ncbi:MAG: hypothetical protein HOP21_03085 [Methylotenera sp.]|nr:hypothetical protein [Methylotenera sp.]
MSKINPIQAAALKTPVVKETVAEKTAKPVITKPVVPVKSAIAKPVVQKTAKVKVEKPTKEKTPKLKMERDSFTIPKAEYAQFYVLKDRLVKLGQPAKKSELLRAGLMQLSAMTDAALKAAMNTVPVIKTGRPKKK